MIETSVKPEVIKRHFQEYFPSLFPFSEKYLPLFGYTVENAPSHLAYICPLCVTNGIIVTNEYGLGMHSEFSLDHYPPQSVGGFETLLVCKNCNNEAGHAYDNSLQQKVQDMAFNKRIPAASKISKRTEITNVIGKYPSQFSFDEEGQLGVNLKPNKKQHTPYLDQFIEDSKKRNDYKITVTINYADDSKVAQALLKAAYLYCFDLWGYEFVFSHTGEMIRKVLKGEISYPIKTPRFLLGDFVKNDISIPKGVCYLSHPVEWKCFMVNMCLTDANTKFSEIVSVLIPGPMKENWDHLKTLDEIMNEHPVQTISMNHVTEFNISNTWNGYTKSLELLNSR